MDLPKYYEIVKAPGGPNSPGPYEWWPVLFDGPVCRNEWDALQECIRHRNAVRADLLRELAAELDSRAFVHDRLGPKPLDEYIAELRDRASRLEASGRTEGP